MHGCEKHEKEVPIFRKTTGSTSPHGPRLRSIGSPCAANVGPASASQVVTPASVLETTVYIERKSPEEALGARLVRGRDAVVVKAIRDSSLLQSWKTGVQPSQPSQATGLPVHVRLTITYLSFVGAF